MMVKSRFTGRQRAFGNSTGAPQDRSEYEWLRRLLSESEKIAHGNAGQKTKWRNHRQTNGPAEGGDGPDRSPSNREKPVRCGRSRHRWARGSGPVRERDAPAA